VRITKSQLRSIIKEVTMEDIFGKKVKSLDDVETIGDFKKLIKYAQSAKRAEKGKEAGEEWAKSTLWDETFGKIPGLSAAKNAADALKSMYDLPDEARTGTALDYMDVDDDVAKIVDDPIENDFLNLLGKELDNMSDDAPMSNLNVTKGLANYMEKKFNARTVAGFSEGRTLKVSKRQLRRVIRETVNDRAMRDTASEEALRWFREGAVGQMTRDSWVTSVRKSPDSYLIPDQDYEVMFRATIRTSGNAKYQVDVVLDAETGAYRGAADVDRY